MDLVVIFGSITLWILIAKWFRFQKESRLEALKNPQKNPEQEAEVRTLKDRVENLENLICRLDSEINYQLERSLSKSGVTTSPVDSLGNSQMPTTFMNIASVLESRYQVLREIGRGGMGIVFQAHDKQLNEQVAIKILSPLLSTDKDALQRLQREVSSARRITHPNVIRIHDISELNGLHFVSMEFFHGMNLKDYLKKSGALSLMHGFNLAAQICDGLEAAHKQGVVHRDLKSQNIIVNAADQIKIIDFGLARSAHLEGLTATGLIMGTPEYMAPEQVAGKKVDERADIYSLGIILYEIFTGQVPFKGDSAIAVGFMQMKEDPPAPSVSNPNLPSSVENVILKALHKEPLHRYRSVSELKLDLERAVTQPELIATEAAPQRKAERVKVTR